MPDPNLIAAHSPLENLYRPGGVREFDRDSLAGLRKSLSHCHDVNQKLILEMNRKQLAITELTAKVTRYKFLNTALTSILTVLAWKGVESLLGR